MNITMGPIFPDREVHNEVSASADQIEDQLKHFWAPHLRLPWCLISVFLALPVALSRLAAPPVNSRLLTAKLGNYPTRPNVIGGKTNAGLTQGAKGALKTLSYTPGWWRGGMRLMWIEPNRLAAPHTRRSKGLCRMHAIGIGRRRMKMACMRQRQKTCTRLACCMDLKATSMHVRAHR